MSLRASAKFQVSATSTNPPIRYQWRFAAADLGGQTNFALNLTNTQVINAGDYDAVLMDGSGSVTSQVAHLEVDATFTKITSGNIVNDGGDSAGCAWGDYDNDGYKSFPPWTADAPTRMASDSGNHARPCHRSGNYFFNAAARNTSAHK